MLLCQIVLLAQSHLPASKHQFLNDTKIKISSKNWCSMAGKWLCARIFGKVAFSIIFIIYSNILKSKVLVHWIEPTARFRHGVCTALCYAVLKSVGHTSSLFSFLSFAVYVLNVAFTIKARPWFVGSKHTSCTTSIKARASTSIFS